MIEIQLDPLYGIDRKAVFECLIYNRRSESVSMQWTVFPVDANGNEIIHPLFKRYSKEFIADKTTMVNSANGDYVQQINVGTEEEPVMEFPDGSVTEYDYFVYIATNAQIIVHDLIVAAGNKAKLAGRFDL